MNQLVSVLGRIIYWMAWPLLWVYVYNTQRTRLLLICEDEILVVKDLLGNGEWTLPGGGIHKHEALERGLIREVQEETGIILTSSQVAKLTTGKTRQHGFRFNYTTFICNIASKPPVIIQRREIINYRWLPVADYAKVRTDLILRESVKHWQAER